MRCAAAAGWLCKASRGPRSGWEGGTGCNRNCYRYIANRPGQFDYPGAIAANLPIGSGEVESAHRFVIQKRLKLPGAWWAPASAQAVLNLRCLRANHRWNDYWTKIAA